MTETLTRPVEYSDEFPNGIQDAEVIDAPAHDLSNEFSTDDTPFEGLEASTEPSETSSVELSPTAARIQRAATRVAGFFERRALKKQQKTEQDATFTDEGGYNENIAATRDRIREERVEKVEESIEKAKERVKGVGRAALNRGAEAGYLAIGAGLLLDEAAGRAVRAGANKIADGGNYVKNTVVTNVETAAAVGSFYKDKAIESTKNGVKNAMDGAEAFAGRVGQKLENGVSNTIEKAAELKRGFIDRMNVAKARRQARRERWAAKFNAAKDTISSTAERGRASVHATRAAGRAAVEAFQTTRNIHAEQNKLY